MRHSLLPFLACLAAAGPAFGQTKSVIPAANATVEGGAFDARPFLSDRVRLMHIMGSSIVTVPVGKTITEIAYRRDGKTLNTKTLTRRSSATWAIRMGNLNTTIRSGAAFRPTSPTGAYMRPGSAANMLTPVYQAVPSWPALPPITSGVAPFSIVFKLQRPFLYRGPSGLVIDHFVYANRRGRFDYLIDSVAPPVDSGKSVNYGKSCPSGANRAHAISSNPGSGVPVSLKLFDGPPRSVAVAILGASRTSWGAVSLPLALDGAGLTGCSIYTSFDILMPVGTFSNGGAQLSLRIPESPAFASMKLYAQWMLIDRRVSQTLPLTFSNGMDITLGSTVGQAAIASSFVYGVNRNQVVRGRFGLVHKGTSLVTQLTWR